MPSLCKAQSPLQVIYFLLHGLFIIPSLGYVAAHTGMASAGLSGVYARLPKPSVLFVSTMLGVWKITLLLGSGQFRLMGVCLMGARSYHIRLLLSLVHKFTPRWAPIVGSTFGRFFTVGENEPKPNGPDTINLVEKMGSRIGL